MRPLAVQLRLLCCLAAGALLIGCRNVNTRVVDDVYTYTNDPSEAANAFFSGVVLLFIGWFVGFLSKRFGCGLIVGGLFVVILVTPAMMMEKAVVSRDEYSHSGHVFWESGTSVKLADVDWIYIQTTVTTRRGVDTYSDKIVCVLHDGSETEFHYNSAISQLAGNQFLKLAKARGIRIDKRPWIPHKKGHPIP